MSASTESALEAGAVASTDGWRAPQGQWQYGRRWEEQALDLALKLDPELDDDSGSGTISVFAPDGSLLERSRLERARSSARAKPVRAGAGRLRADA